MRNAEIALFLFLSLSITSAALADHGGKRDDIHPRRPVSFWIESGIGPGSYQSVFAHLGLSAEYGLVFATVRWQGALSYRYGGLSAAGGRVREIGVLAGLALRKGRFRYSVGAGIGSIYSSLHPDIWTFQEILPFEGVGVPLEARASWIASSRLALDVRLFTTQISKYSYGGLSIGARFGKLR